MLGQRAENTREVLLLAEQPRERGRGRLERAVDLLESADLRAKFRELVAAPGELGAAGLDEADVLVDFGLGERELSPCAIELRRRLIGARATCGKRLEERRPLLLDRIGTLDEKIGLE